MVRELLLMSQYIRKHVRMFLEALFHQDEKDWKHNRENAKNELLGEVKDARLASLSTVEIKELVKHVRKMEDTMLEQSKFKAPKNIPKSKVKLKFNKDYAEKIKKNIFSDYSGRFLYLAKSKKQRQLELAKKILDEKLNEKNKEIERLKRLLEEKEKNQQDDKKPKIMGGFGIGFFDKEEENLPSLKLDNNFDELENFLKQNEIKNFSETIDSLKNVIDNNQLDHVLQDLWSSVYKQCNGDEMIMNPFKGYINKIVSTVENYTFEPNTIPKYNEQF